MTLDKNRVRKFLNKLSGCDLQEGNSCNTCFHSIDLGVDEDIIHLLWIVQCSLRDDYTSKEVLSANVENFKELIKKYEVKQ